MTTINNISFWPIININAAPNLYGRYILQTTANSFLIDSKLAETPLFEALIEIFNNPDKAHIGFYANCFIYNKKLIQLHFYLNYVAAYDNRYSSPIIGEFSHFYIKNPKAVRFYSDNFKKLLMTQ